MTLSKLWHHTRPLWKSLKYQNVFQQPHHYDQFILSAPQYQVNSKSQARLDLSHKFDFDETLIPKLYPIQMSLLGQWGSRLGDTHWCRFERVHMQKLVLKIEMLLHLNIRAIYDLDVSRNWSKWWGQYLDHSRAISDLASCPLIGRGQAILSSDWSIILPRVITASGSDDHSAASTWWNCR